MSRLTRDGTAEPVSRDQILRHERGQEILFFPVQLTTSRIGNLTRLIHTLAICLTLISGRSPPLFCTLTLIAMQGHQNPTYSGVNVMTFFSLTGGCSEGLDAFRFFSKNKNNVV